MNPGEKVKYISNWIKSYVDQMPNKAQSLVIVSQEVLIPLSQVL